MKWFCFISLQVTKYLGNLKSGVEARVVENESGDRRYDNRTIECEVVFSIEFPSGSVAYPLSFSIVSFRPFLPS